MHWFLWLVWAALLVAILAAVGPTGIGVVWAFLSLMWPGILGGLLIFVCGGTVAAALLMPGDVWWRRAAFGLPALAGVAWLAAWEPSMLCLAAFGAGIAAWERFKGLPSWLVGELPPAS